MVLNKRERYTAIGAGAAIGLLLLNFAVINPYLDSLKEAEDGFTSAQRKLDDYNSLVAQQPSLTKKWGEMQDEGLEVDEAQAEGQLRNAILKWSDENQIQLQTTQPPHATQRGKFQEISMGIGFDVAGQRGMYDIAHLFWAIESAPIPIRVNDMQIKAVRDGFDNLSITLTVSALCMPPADTATPGSNTPAPAAAPAGDM